MYANYGVNIIKDSKEMTTSNKVKNSCKQYGNFLKTNAKDALILSGGAAAAIGVAKSSKVQNLISKGLVNLKNTTFVKNIAKEVGFSKFVNYVKSLPGPAKAIGAIITALTLGAINLNHDKASYNAGKITQEYIDKSKIEKSI